MDSSHPGIAKAPRSRNLAQGRSQANRDCWSDGNLAYLRPPHCGGSTDRPFQRHAERRKRLARGEVTGEKGKSKKQKARGYDGGQVAWREADEAAGDEASCGETGRRHIILENTIPEAGTEYGKILAHERGSKNYGRSTRKAVGESARSYRRGYYANCSHGIATCRGFENLCAIAGVAGAS